MWPCLALGTWCEARGAQVRKAIVILGSEKTLPVSMAVLAFLPPELGAKGLIAVTAFKEEDRVGLTTQAMLRARFLPEKSVPPAVPRLRRLELFHDCSTKQVPCILGHLSQLLMDAVVASKWAERTPDDDEKPVTGGRGAARAGGRLPSGSGRGISR